MRESDWCFWHSPDHRREAQEARRLGGIHRRRESTVSGAFDVEGIGNIEGIRRVLEIALLDTLGLENGVQRSRVLVSIVQAAAKLLEVSEYEQRFRALESVVFERRAG